MDTLYPLARNCLGICGQDDAGRIGGGRSGRNRPANGCWHDHSGQFGIGIPFFFFKKGCLYRRIAEPSRPADALRRWPSLIFIKIR